jgi:hypothetical protein
VQSIHNRWLELGLGLQSIDKVLILWVFQMQSIQNKWDELPKKNPRGFLGALLAVV